AADLDAPGNPDLLILDTPRPGVLALVQQHLGDQLEAADTPWIRVGWGPPAFGNLPAPPAKRLTGYYGHGGVRHLRPLVGSRRPARSCRHALDTRRRGSAGLRQPAGTDGQAPDRLLRQRRRAQPASPVRLPACLA